MSLLPELQRSFSAALFDSHVTPPDDVISNAVRHPVRRFNVYRNNVVTSLVDVLEAYFPVVGRLVGSEFFRAMARAFVVVTPPASPILSRYGAEFPQFLTTFPPIQDLPYLADVARLEWLRQRAYHAADAPPLRGEQLATVPADQVRNIAFRPHPSLGLLSSVYPVVSIWRTNALDDEVCAVTLEAGDEYALIVRPRLEVHVVPVSVGTHIFATSLVSGNPLGAASADAIAIDREFNLQASLASLIERGTFSSFELSGVKLSRKEDH